MSELFQTGIRPAVDAYLKAKGEETRSYGEYWSASSAGYCMRLNIMRRMGVPKVPELQDNAALIRIFEVGHIFHEWMQRITKDAGLSIASEIELQDEDLMVRGHFDDLVLVNDMQPGQLIPYEGKSGGEGERKAIAAHQHLILYDYKTAHSASFNYSKNRQMGDYHRMQLGTYMYMLNKKNQQLLDFVAQSKQDALQYKLPVIDVDTSTIGAINEARILSISKDDLRMDEKQLMWSPDLEKDIVSYWTTLNGYWRARTMPKCTCLDMDDGFLGKRSSKGKIYGDFFYEDEPCSLKWFAKMKEEGKIKGYNNRD